MVWKGLAIFRLLLPIHWTIQCEKAPAEANIGVDLSLMHLILASATKWWLFYKETKSRTKIADGCVIYKRGGRCIFFFFLFHMWLAVIGLTDSSLFGIKTRPCSRRGQIASRHPQTQLCFKARDKFGFFGKSHPNIQTSSCNGAFGARQCYRCGCFCLLNVFSISADGSPFVPGFYLE